MHVSLVQTNSREEPSSDGKTKKSLSKRLKIFSTGWKAKQRKAEIAADSNGEFFKTRFDLNFISRASP